MVKLRSYRDLIVQNPEELLTNCEEISRLLATLIISRIKKTLLPLTKN